MVNMKRAQVQHNRVRSRYEIVVGGRVAGIAEYQAVGRDVVFTHTEVVPSLRGQGYAVALVRGALDHVRRANKRVVPRCWFVAQFLADHPQYADLRAA